MSVLHGFCSPTVFPVILIITDLVDQLELWYHFVKSISALKFNFNSQDFDEHSLISLAPKQHYIPVVSLGCFHETDSM